MTAIDRRIAARRHTVREASARRRLIQIVVALVFIFAVGMIAMLLRSPVMAVSVIDVQGAQRADVAEILDRYDIVAGIPTISVRADEIEEIIEAEPWVSRAQVTIRWPDTISVVVLEHEPVAWVEISEEWFRVSATGAVVERGEPPSKGAKVRLAGLNGTAGSQLKGKRSLGALEFIDSLPKELRRRALVTGGGAGTLAARITGHRVELGSATDMTEKAAALNAILEQGVPRRAIISLVSPIRPAIRHTQQSAQR